MNYLNEFSEFYKPNDLVLIEYWYNSMITPVRIQERKKNKYLVSHDNNFSKIKNAPDELIKSSDILGRYQNKSDI
jgi:hypothetical protein